MPSWISYLLRSVILGVVLSVVLLFMIPELRQQDNGLFDLFRDEPAIPEPLSFHDAISTAAPAVVNIYSYSIDNRPLLFRRQPVERTGLGSGVIMASEGFILTCYHVVQSAEELIVQLQDGRALVAQIVGVDPYTDLAVLKVQEDNLPVMPQQVDPNTKVGDLVMAIGNPYNLGQTITQGIVSATGRSRLNSGILNSYSADFIQMDAVLNEGNSGGALINSNGTLVGINNASYKTLDSRRRVKEVEGVYFAVPYVLARKVMDSIISHGRVIRGFLGINASETPDQEGIRVTGTTPNGPAEMAGILAGDVILKVDDTVIDSSFRMAETLDLIAEKQPGSEVVFELARGDSVVTLAVVVADLDRFRS